MVLAGEKVRSVRRIASLITALAFAAPAAADWSATDCSRWAHTPQYAACMDAHKDDPGVKRARTIQKIEAHKLLDQQRRNREVAPRTAPRTRPIR